MAMQEWQTAGWPAEQENCYCVRAPKVWMAKRAEDGADESVSSDIRRIVGRYFKIADGVYRQEPRDEGTNNEELFIYLAAKSEGWYIGADPNEIDGEEGRVAWSQGDQYPSGKMAVPSWVPPSPVASAGVHKDLYPWALHQLEAVSISWACR